MAGHYPWAQLRAKMTPEQRAQSQALFEQKRLGLMMADLRKEFGLTQTELAERLGIGQSTISQIESSGDMQVTTLKKIVTALGGRVVLQMPSGEIALPAAGE